MTPPARRAPRALLALILLLGLAVLVQGLYLARTRPARQSEPAASPAPSRQSVLAPPAGPGRPSVLATPPGGLAPRGSARPRPFSGAAPEDYDVNEYMYALLQLEQESPSLTSEQAEKILQLFGGTFPDLRASRDLYSLAAEHLTSRQKEFLDLELDFYKPPTPAEQRAFLEKLKKAAGVTEVPAMKLPTAVVRQRKNTPYLDLVAAHFDALQEHEELRLSREQMLQLLPFYRYFLDEGVCSTTDTCLGEILTEAQKAALADRMVTHAPLAGERGGVGERLLELLRARVQGARTP